MVSESKLQRINERGWRVGLANLLRKENGEWWGTRTWLVQAVIWLAIINGLLAMILWVAPAQSRQAAEAGRAAQELTGRQAAIEGVEVFFMIGAMATAVGISIVMQGAIMDEKQSGTLAWVLSKPVARPAVIIAKLVANSIGALAILILLQGAVAFAQLRLAGSDVAPGPFLLALGILGLHLLFYLTLTLMLGVLFNNRGPVIAISLLLVFGYQILLGIAPGLHQITPYGLVVQAGPNNPALTLLIARGDPVPSLLPVAATVVWIAIFIGVALWRFERQEF